MAPASLESASRQTREISPFFSLPNEDGSNPHTRYDSDQSQSQLPPITLSCASCERIVGDSSAFLCATRQMGTITLDKMVSVTFGLGLKTSVEGEWDEFCNYKDVNCGKCSGALGKMYFATTSKLSALQNKYTVNLTTLSFYHHASATPSLPIAATSEIYAQLHPDPETVAENIDHIMTICVMLREEQGDIIRELKKLGAATGVEVDLEEGETAVAVKEKSGTLDGVMGKVKDLEEQVARMEKMMQDKVKEFEDRIKTESKLQRGTEEGVIVKEKMPTKKRQDDVAMSDLMLPPPRRQEKEKEKKAMTTQKLAPSVAAANKRKRKSGVEAETIAVGDKQAYIDLSNDEYTSAPAPAKQKSKKEVPNSQSADEDEGDGEYQDELGSGDHEDEDEDEGIEDRIKSPAEKRRKGVTVSIVARKELTGRRATLGRKGK